MNHVSVGLLEKELLSCDFEGTMEILHHTIPHKVGARFLEVNHKTADRDCARHMSEPRCPGGLHGHY